MRNNRFKIRKKLPLVIEGSFEDMPQINEEKHVLTMWFELHGPSQCGERVNWMKPNGGDVFSNMTNKLTPNHFLDVINPKEIEKEMVTPVSREWHV